MGVGLWKGKQNWPEQVHWMKVVTEMKIFGFTICSTYQQTLKQTWERVVKGFQRVLFSWQSRQLETLAQRVEVTKTFALSKLYYVAQVLPLPNKYRKQIDSSLSKFIFRGRHERLQLDELQNSYEQGGLGLPNIAVKADSLLLKQMCRMMNLPDEKSFRLLGYWLGEFLRDTGLGENFLELADLGPVSHTMSGTFPQQSCATGPHCSPMNLYSPLSWWQHSQLCGGVTRGGGLGCGSVKAGSSGGSAVEFGRQQHSGTD